MTSFEQFQLRITNQTHRSFVKECADSISANLWICSRCGIGSFRLERANAVDATSCTRNCNWRTVPRTETFTTYLTANRHIDPFALPSDQPQHLRLCPTCCNAQKPHKAARVPTVLNNTYNAAVAESSFDQLQLLSIIQPQYKSFTKRTVMSKAPGLTLLLLMRPCLHMLP
jgi:hypothetical protein